ncbi:NAD(P)-dependent oxidoreductase [Candidatus Woesearchaeota archaeon]|nr:NAD(P)-dependent oxidoreductase [Candidatus Woesearchaeota archaeon]
MKSNKDIVLVTGANGFIGQHLVIGLLKKGYKVSALVRKTSNIEELTSINDKNFKVIHGDVTDYASLLEATKNIDFVMHLAGVIHPVNVDDSFYWNVNVKGTENVIKACVENKIKLKKFVHCSSVSCFGNLKDPDNTVLDESFPCNPENIYGVTKYNSELVAFDLAKKYNIPLTAIRPGRVYGPGDYSLKPLLKLIKKRLFFHVGSDKCYMMPVYVDDLVNAFILAMENPNATGNAYIITGSDAITKREFTNIVAKELNVKPNKLSFPKYFVIPSVYLLEKFFLLFNKEPPISRKKLRFFLSSRRYSIDKAKKELGYEPKENIINGMQKTIEWYNQKRII